MKRLACGILVLVGLVAGCTPASIPTTPGALTSPTPDPSSYYGDKPLAATLVAGGRQQTAGVGTFFWTVEKKGESSKTLHADAFALVTPGEPLTVTSPITGTLLLPIPIAPSTLWYRVTPATQDLDRGVSDGGSIRWQAGNGQPGTSLVLESRVEIPLSLEQGKYLLEVYAAWPDLGSVDYGFYLEIQSSGMPTNHQTVSSGATITGQVITGFGDHRPFAGLPLRIRQKNNNDWDTYTDGDGFFTLTNLPLGRVDIDDSHLFFQVSITSTSHVMDLGKLRYPLIHPPLYYWWQAAPLSDLNQLLKDGKTVDFKVCKADPDWVRPNIEMQRQQVYRRPPFNQMGEERFQKYEQIAVLYNTIDETSQSFPGGPNLDGLGADWLYLTGLWATPRNPLSSSNCSYAPAELQSLLDRSQLEVWLFGYRATYVQELDKEVGVFDETALCNPDERSCTFRPGYHYAVHVEPAAGFQIIRFAGKPDVLAIHIIESGKEILALP